MRAADTEAGPAWSEASAPLPMTEATPLSELARPSPWVKFLEMALLDVRSDSRARFWQIPFAVGVFVLGLCMLLPSPPHQSRLDPMYLSRLGIMGGAILGISFLNLRVLVPVMLEKRRYLIYGLSLAALIVLGAFSIYGGNSFALGIWSSNRQGGPGPKISAPVVDRGFADRGGNVASRSPGPPTSGMRAGGPPAIGGPGARPQPGVRRGPPPGESGVNRPYGPPQGRATMSSPDGMGRMLVVFGTQLTIGVVALALIFHIRAWRRARDAAQRKLEAELAALKAQLNPHFLFNSLNNIYALALDQSRQAPDYVLKLSELMRYILHDSQAVVVPLRKELEFVQNYLDLERIRMEDTVEMKLEVQGEPDGVQVAPLLMLPFVENAFKHGVYVQPTNAFVVLKVTVADGGGLIIDACNSKDDRDEGSLMEPPCPLTTERAPGGVGLENLRRRLELLYPEQHELRLADRGDRYEVKLRLETCVPLTV